MHPHEPSCEWVREHLDALIDDEFESTPEERGALERHAAACAACARELDLAKALRDEFRAMAFTAVSPAVIARAQAEIGAEAARVVPLRAHRRWVRRASLIAAAAAVIIAAVGIQERRRAAHELAVKEAAQDAAIAFAYLGKYTRRAGSIVGNEVIEERLLAPVERAMEKSGVGETKSSSTQS